MLQARRSAGGTRQRGARRGQGPGCGAPQRCLREPGGGPSKLPVGATGGRRARTVSIRHFGQ
eukprot:5659320-Lingulodinium_polyedra.AAC.1